MDLSKGIVVLPPSLFLFLFSIFLCFCGLIGSFYLSLVCPLWDLLILSSLGSSVSSLRSFPHFKGNTLYFTRMKRISHTLQEVLNIKKTESKS